MLTTGTKAPDFSLSTKNAEGLKLVTLSEQAGEKVLLLFFPMAFTSVCTEELCSISQGLEEYDGTVVLGLSGDSPFAQEAWGAQEKITIPLLSDYDHKVAQAYGIAYDQFAPQLNLPMGGVAKRSAFVIDQNGVIQYAESNDDPRKLPDFSAIKATLAGLK
jgi:peroxiredoxin|tara:strand:- start:203 stop:685 length:483 start_codon:yes stop_codon:yes gene_type:complete